MTRFDPSQAPNGPHPHLEVAQMLDSGALELSPAVLSFLSSDEIRLALRRFFAGNWGTCDEFDREQHAEREGYDLLACDHQTGGLRLHFLSDAERTMTRVVAAGEA